MNDLVHFSPALFSFQPLLRRTRLTILTILFVSPAVPLLKKNETLGHLFAATALCFSLTGSPLIRIRN